MIQSTALMIPGQFVLPRVAGGGSPISGDFVTALASLDETGAPPSAVDSPLGDVAHRTASPAVTRQAAAVDGNILPSETPIDDPATPTLPSAGVDSPAPEAPTGARARPRARLSLPKVDPAHPLIVPELEVAPAAPKQPSGAPDQSRPASSKKHIPDSAGAAPRVKPAVNGTDLPSQFSPPSTPEESDKDMAGAPSAATSPAAEVVPAIASVACNPIETGAQAGPVARDEPQSPSPSAAICPSIAASPDAAQSPTAHERPQVGVVGAPSAMASVSSPDAPRTGLPGDRRSKSGPASPNAAPVDATVPDLAKQTAPSEAPHVEAADAPERRMPDPVALRVATMVAAGTSAKPGQAVQVAGAPSASPSEPALAASQPASKSQSLSPPTVHPAATAQPSAPPVSAVRVAVAFAPPPTPSVQPAAQAFAAAMFVAEGQDARESADDPSSAIQIHGANFTTIHTPVFLAPAAAGGPPLDLGRHDWMDAMIERIETMQGEGGVRETRMRLAPDALGSVDVAIQQDEHGAVQIRVTAETPQARAMLADAAPRLAEMAEARGLKLAGGHADGGPGNPGQHDRPKPEVAQPARPASVMPTAENDTDLPPETRIA